MSSTDTAKVVAERFIQAWNAGHLHIVDELAASDLTVAYTHFPEPLRGPEAFKHMLSQTHSYFPDLAVEVEEVVATEDRAAVEWIYRGTFQSGEMFGVEATGQTVEVKGLTIYEIEDGEVKVERGLVDNLGLMMQLGALPEPG
jgi:steroid delta-isomerase-like uncharacterized protein